MFVRRPVRKGWFPCYVGRRIFSVFINGMVAQLVELGIIDMPASAGSNPAHSTNKFINH